MNHYQEEPRDFMTQDDLVAMHKPEPSNTKQEELVAAYPSMRFLKNTGDLKLIDEWYDVMVTEKEALGNWAMDGNKDLPANHKYFFKNVYVNHISHYHYNGVKKQRVFFGIPEGDTGVYCVHSGALTEELTKGWHTVKFTTSGTEQVLGRKVNKVSGLKLETF